MARIISLRDHAPAELHAVDEAPPHPVAARRRMRPAFIALMTTVVLVGTIVIATLVQLRATHEFERLPADLRQSVYLRNVEELRSVCLQPAASSGQLRVHCLEVAGFVDRLPECTGACRTIVDRVLPPPAHK